MYDKQTNILCKLLTRAIRSGVNRYSSNFDPSGFEHGPISQVTRTVAMKISKVDSARKEPGHALFKFNVNFGGS